MRKYLESEMLASALKGRIRYSCTTYVGMDGCGKKRKEFDDEEFSNALEQYRFFDITKSIHSDNPIIRMFAILDRRLGKRTLQKLINEIELQPAWLQYFYRLRMSAENIDCV